MLSNYVPRALIVSATIVAMALPMGTHAFGQAHAAKLVTQTTMAKGGYLFLNDRYIQPPYDIQRDKNALVINGERFSADEDVLSEYQKTGSGRQPDGSSFMGNPRFRMASAGFGQGPGRRRGGRTQTSPLARFQSHVKTSAELDVLVLLDNRKPLFLEMTGAGQSVLQVLLGTEDDSTSEFLGRLSQYDQESIRLLTNSFQLDEAFRTRASSHLDAMESVQAENRTLAQANIWIERIGYPLTTAAMVLVVMAFGHLLSHKPTLSDAAMEEFPNATKTVVGRSLAIVALLSIVDLIWTMAAAETGSIRELNPLGSKLLHNPMQLILFKFVATAIAIGLLYRLKQQPIAQLASWWSCLILTLLTARWLTFNSMFL